MDDETSLWWIGATMNVFGSVLINLGSNLIRKGHTELEKKEKKPVWYKQPLPLIGWSLFGVGNLVNFISFMFAAQSLLAALGSVQFISNLFFATIINRETLTVIPVIATIAIVGGNVLIVTFGSKVSKTYGYQELIDFLFRPMFLLFVGAVIITVLIMQLIYLAASWYVQKHIGISIAQEFDIPVDNDTTQSKIASVTMSMSIPVEKPSILIRICWWVVPISYAVVSAMIGCNNMLFGKIGAGILAQALHNIEELLSIWSIVIAVLFTIFTAFWLYRLNVALSRYDAMFIIPVLQAIWLVTSVLEGGIFFQEFSYMSPTDIVLFTVGIGILVCGVLVLSTRGHGQAATKAKNYEVIDDSENL